MKRQFKTIENTMRFEKKDIYQIDLLDDSNGKQQSFECTANHPFYVIDKGFVRTDHLTLTDQCLDCYGNKLAIKSIHKAVKIDTVYDLTVANTHTFFVGNSGVWVHNSSSSAVEAASTNLPPTLDRTPLTSKPYTGILADDDIKEQFYALFHSGNREKITAGISSLNISSASKFC